MADECNAVVAVLLLLLHSCPYGVGSNSQVYEENLFLRGLPGDKVLAFFMFKTTWHISPEVGTADSSIILILKICP